jgi:5-methyltetrahydropteroyltriglutamate--homocysteine methyltransferase
MPLPLKRPPFRAEHVGSLLRPPELRAAYRQFADGSLDAEGFRGVQNQSIRDVVKIQEDIGLQAVNDGEFRRISYWAHFVDSTDGLEVSDARFDFHNDQGDSTNFLAPLVTGPVSRARPISGGEFDYLNSIATAQPKITLPSPPTMHFWTRKGAAVGAGYPTDSAFFADLAQVFREEIADLAARGARYIQIDEVPLAMLCDPDLRDRLRADGEDPDALITAYVDLINQSLADRPEDMTVAMHLCRGNFKGKWLSEGGYAYVAERLFNDIEVDGFFLEYDTPRAGDFAPLAAVPSEKTVVLGLVSSKTPELEDKAALARRVDEAAKFIPLDQLAISPQCGFASTVAGNPVTLDDEIAKLQLVVDTAREVWG